MTYTNRFFTIISVVLATLFFAGRYIRMEEISFSSVVYYIFLFVIIFPILVSQVLLYIFKKGKKTKKLQWIPNVLSVLGILFLLGMQTWNFEELTGSDQWSIEERRIEKTIGKWIKDNATHPSSYERISFYDLTQTVFPHPQYMTSNNDRPARFLISDFNMKFDYAYYFIKHEFLLKNNEGIIDTVHALFQLTPDLHITNVRMPEELHALNALSRTEYAWRNKYGNEKHNLELELHGNNGTEYTYMHFNEEGVFKWIIPYSNSTINGTVYYLRNPNDTGAIVTYKNGLRHGYVMELANNIVRFKGTTQNGRADGIATSYYENGQKSREGMRYDGIEIDIWNYWDENGKLVKTKDMGHHELADTLKHRVSSQ